MNTLPGYIRKMISPRGLVNIKILKSVYYAIFDPYLNYANTVWGQNKNFMNRLIILQKRALRIMSLECRNAPYLSVNLFNSIFHQFSIIGLLFLQAHITMKPLAKKYGSKAMINNAISSWNDIPKDISSHALRDLSSSKLKSLLAKHFLETYSND